MSKPKSTANQARTRAAWGPALPAWVLALAQACDEGSQATVAKLLGVSPAMVNQVMGNCYKGRLDGLETRVRGEFMKETVECPILGPISKRDCLDHHTRTGPAHNQLRRQLAIACQDCSHNTKRST